MRACGRISTRTRCWNGERRWARATCACRWPSPSTRRAKRCSRSRTTTSARCGRCCGASRRQIEERAVGRVIFACRWPPPSHLRTITSAVRRVGGFIGRSPQPAQSHMKGESRLEIPRRQRPDALRIPRFRVEAGDLRGGRAGAAREGAEPASGRGAEPLRLRYGNRRGAHDLRGNSNLDAYALRALEERRGGNLPARRGHRHLYGRICGRAPSPRAAARNQRFQHG